MGGTRLAQNLFFLGVPVVVKDSKSSNLQKHSHTNFFQARKRIFDPYTNLFLKNNLFLCVTRRLEDPESFTNTRIQKTSLRSSLVPPITAPQTLRSILVLLSKSHNFAALMCHSTELLE